MKKSQKVTPDELIEFCRKRLSSFKKPESVVFVDELPRNRWGRCSSGFFVQQTDNWINSTDRHRLSLHKKHEGPLPLTEEVLLLFRPASGLSSA